jgi:cytochrome P450
MPDTSSLTFAPGPQGLLFLKTVIGFYRDPIRLFADLHQQYGNLVRLQGGPYCAHLITQPEQVKYVLQDNAKNYRQGQIFQETAPVVGRGLTTNSGPSWLKQRRMVQFAFQHKYVAALGEGMAIQIEETLPRWVEHVRSQKPMDIDAEVLKLNHRILGKLLFSYDFQEHDPFLDALAIVRKVSIDRVRSLIKLPSSRRFDHAVKTLDEFAYRQIAEHHRENPPVDILSMLIESKDAETGLGMNDTELHDEIMTLFFAAYEDVANAIAWTCYLLSQNPQVEDRLRAEVNEVLGGRAATAADLRDLPYVSMLVNEVLRLYPTTWSLLREAVQDDQIDGFHIPADSMILMDCYLTHRLPQYWPDPERFEPERFSPERSAGRPRFAYFPFGGGPRQCIGNELALMEIKMILIRMVQLYRFPMATKKPVQMHPLSSLQPYGGVWVKIRSI